MPDYPANRKNSEDKGIKVTYAKVLKEDRRLQKGEVINATKLSTAKLCVFFETEMADCSEEKLMMLLHMKPTKMRVSDPFILTAELFKTLTAELFKTLMRIVTGQVCFKEVSNSGGFVCQVPVCPGRIVTEVLSARGGSFTKVLSARGGSLPRSCVPGEDCYQGPVCPGRIVSQGPVCPERIAFVFKDLPKILTVSKDLPKILTGPNQEDRAKEGLEERPDLEALHFIKCGILFEYFWDTFGIILGYF